MIKHLHFTVALAIDCDLEDTEKIESELRRMAKKINAYPVTYVQVTEKQVERYKQGGRTAWQGI